ncbi:FecR family protein [Magnetovibrio sp.]|uniref:FecR family protein n=1 Tax=Magnetovibrio sp. TaxID=2024836 RepID=UPI002F926647
MKHFRANTFWRHLKAVLTAFVGLIVLVQAPVCQATETVGKVVKQRMDAYGTAPGQSRERKFPRYNVVFGELIETDGGAAILIEMNDDTELFLGERASLVIDEFVYDPGSASMRAVYNFTLGTLRFVSGKMANDGISIVTPSAAIGLRGSDAVIFVTPDGGTIINVLEGTFTVRSRETADGPVIDVGAKENVSIARGGTITPISEGLQLPDYTHEFEAKTPDYSDDYYDLTVGGAFESARPGKVTGSAGADEGHGDGGGHHDAAD